MKNPTLRVPYITANLLADWYLILYLCNPMMVLICNKALSYLGLMEYGSMVALFITYIPLCILFIYYGLKKKKLSKYIPEFWILLLVITIFFGVTYLLHPEYKYWYFRDTYGVFSYVLRPDNGLYLYLAIRLVNDPKRIMNDLRISGWIMYVYYGRQLLQALSTGYWTDTSNKGYEIHMSYSLSFGYNVLLFALAFLYLALETKTLMNWFGACVGIVMILLGGSRGPILDIGIFIILYAFIKITASKKKNILMTGLICGGGILLLTYEYILRALISIFDKFGVSSRFITMMLEGEVSDDNGRELIWNTAINMIKENPLGYGAMGTRHVIGNIIFVGHPHQIFLEILVDFGVIIGSVLIIWMLFSTYKILMNKNIGEWKGIFVLFFARACQLLLSLTFWHSIGLWGVIAIGVCISLSEKEGSFNKWRKVGLPM